MQTLSSTNWNLEEDLIMARNSLYAEIKKGRAVIDTCLGLIGGD